jgi:hypothetical protein
MKSHHQPSGLHHGLSLLIDPQWSPEQAMAVIELLDDLRDRIGTHYESTLLNKYRDERITRHDRPVTDPPF